MFSKIIVAVFAFVACTQAFMMPQAVRSSTSMTAESTDRRAFAKSAFSAGLATAAAFGGVTAANAGWLSGPQDRLPKELNEEGPGVIKGKEFTPKQNAQGMKLESKVESKIDEKNAKGPKSGNRSVEKRMDSEREAPTNKPLTL